MDQFLQVFAYCGQGSTFADVDGPVVELPRVSVAVTLMVTFPPTLNGPMKPDQLEPDPDIVALPPPDGPVHFRTTESSPEASDAATPTLTVRPADPQDEAPRVGRPTVGADPWVRRTVTGTVPPSQTIEMVPLALPSEMLERCAAITTVALPPPGIELPAVETDSHGTDVPTR